MLLLWVSCFSGIASHHAFFIRKEHHLQAGLLLRLHLFATFALWFILLQLGRKTPFHATVVDIGMGLSFYFGLFSSMIVYRICFHPLCKFPGPVGASVSKLWHVWQVRDAKQYLVLEKLHASYGDFVRTGPNEICVFRPDALKPIHGYGSSCSKSAWYDNLKPYTAMNTTRDRTEHDQRRRLYERGLSTKAVRGYEDRVFYSANELKIAFSRLTGNPIDATIWFQYFAFDVMGQLGFGRSFNQVRTAESHFETDFLRQGMSILALVTPVPWLYHLALSIPGLTKDWQALLSWSAQQAMQKVEAPEKQRDIMSSIIEDWLAQDQKQRDAKLLGGDAIAVVIAGSQTVAAALTFVFYRLAKHPDWADLLVKEVSDSGKVDSVALQSMTYLNAFIQETLRLHPPVPSAGLRDTPPEGITIGDQHIPGGVTVLAPNYSLGRLEASFRHADQFLPERWCTAPHLVIDGTGFRPFGIGPYSCVGKNLALMEVRAVVAVLLKTYRISFAPGEDCFAMFSELKDVFTASPGKCELVFEHRSKFEAI